MDNRINTISIDNCQEILDVIKLNQKMGEYVCLGKCTPVTKRIIKEYQNVNIRLSRYKRRFNHFINSYTGFLHFITVSCDMLYFHQRYFNHYNTTRLHYAKKFQQIISKIVGNIPCNITFEESRRAGKFIHAHIIIYCKKSIRDNIIRELKDSFTNEHKLYKNGLQKAIKLSEKNISTIEKAIKYFLGLNPDGSWKKEFYCYSSNFEPKSLCNVLGKKTKNANIAIS